MEEKRAHERAVKIAKGYWDNTIANDAQSYITLEEFIRRKDADGTLNEYQDLIAQLLDPNVSAEEIDLDAINARIQVQKNFYYDKVFDADTGQFIPRQIKNAEFVLIPKLLPPDSELRKVYDWMVKNDIGQLNTAETDKAAKKNIFTIWDDVVENGKHKVIFIDPNTNPDFNNVNYIQNYKYKYLYKQQDVPQHMMNEENKLGSQISKKIVDNISTVPEHIQRYAKEYQDAYTYNIREDFMNFLDSMGWEIDNETGHIVNAEYATTDIDGNPLNEETIKSNRETLNLSNYYARARQEAIRLGMDSNFMEYLTTDEFGNPLMPNSMNNVQQKLESVGQALFNRAITRQTLPGWHAAQITGVGYSKTLEFDAETGIMQVYLPRWSNLIPKGKTPEENEAILKQIETEGLDIHLGYRIPTEGKQSISVLKVVGFTNDALGSTIVVPDAWVTQTGSDFDVDSIYGICWELYRKKGKDGKITVHKIPHEENTTDDRMLYVSYVNARLENKVKRNDLGEEIDSVVKEIKARIHGEQREANAKRTEFDEMFKKEDAIRNEIYKKRLPGWARGIITDINKTAKKRAKENATVVDLTDAYSAIDTALSEYLKKHKVSEEVTKAVQDYLDQQTTLLNIINAQRGLYTFNKENYFTEKTDAIKQTIEDNINAWVTNVETEAAKIGIMSFEEFKALPFVERLSKRARNNYILHRMIEIMKDASSREEQYGRSQFEDIVGEDNSANSVIDRIADTNTKLISPYNPLTQLDYFDDAMSGASLKARSVNWDTMASKSNFAHGYLSNEDAVYAVLDMGEKSEEASAITYSQEDIDSAYKEDIVEWNDEDRIVDIDSYRMPSDAEGQMSFVYGENKRSDVMSKNTFDAIVNGERTATTRYTFDGNIEYWSNLKKRNIVKFTDNKGRHLFVRVTKPLTKLTNRNTAEAWSRKEGWSVDYFNRKVKPLINKGQAYQFEYEYISPNEYKSIIKDRQNTKKEIIKDKPKFTWAKISNNNYEVSSANDKRFSAFYAQLNDGRYIEDIYQLDIKGNGVAKAKPLTDRNNPTKSDVKKTGAFTRKVSREQSWKEYKDLWRQYLDENPDLEKDLLEKAKGKVLTDKYANTEVSQARALAELLNERHGLIEDNSIINERATTEKAKNTEEAEIERIGKDNVLKTIDTLNSDNNELSFEEKKIITEKLGKRPRVLVASEATDPVFHAKAIKKMVEDELAKPADQRKFHMMYIITKHDGLPFRELAELKIPKFIHFSITSLGSTKYEPGVMKADDLLDRIEKFIKEGVINPNLVTVRIDPIIPGVTKKEDIRHIMERAKAMDIRQFKFSLMDSYGNYDDRFVVSKMRELGYPWETYYNVITNSKGDEIVDFNPKQEYINDFYTYMDNLAEELNVHIHTCGENPKGLKLKKVRTNVGCINVQAMNKAMGTTDISYVRGKQRPECSCYGNKQDTCNYGSSCASSCVYCYAKHNGDAVMNYYNEDGTLKDNAFTRTAKGEVGSDNYINVKGVGDDIQTYHLYTGVDFKNKFTDGGDSIFNTVAKEFGLKVTGYGPQHMEKLTEEQANEVEKAYLQAREDLARPFLANTIKDGGLFTRRDYLQAKAADAIFAIGNIIYPGQLNSRGKRSKAADPVVDGGTGYAVQMAINMSKPVHVYVPSEKQWYRYDYNTSSFIKEAVPVLTPKFAGIGTRQVKDNPEVVEAIRELFTVTRDGRTMTNYNSQNEYNTVNKDSKQVLIKANKFGWSNNNKNIVGNFVTTYTAETTSHHLDAVKRGSVQNVNEYTFDVYKLLTCLGLDYEFAIGFMRQPIISRLVSNYNLTNSIYFGDSSNPIDMTIADIAKDLNLDYSINRNGKTANRANVNKHTPLYLSIQSLKDSPEFVNAFNSIFGVDISELSFKDIINMKFPLRKDFIFNRIRNANKAGTNKLNLDNPSVYHQAAVDLSMLITFRQLLATTKKLNTIIQFSAVDKVGAKPSIRETRRIVENVDQFRNDTTFMVGDKTWANALFPIDKETGRVDVNSSINRPIAAAYTYATLPSVEVGSKVFINESEDYIEAEKYAQKKIGKRFDEQTYKEWRRYGMISLYNSIGKLLEPLCVDERGRIIPFIDNTETSDTQPKTANLFYNEERSRIVGYGIVSESNFTVEDINKPTDAEIAKYLKLTPAQKVLFIQRNFPDNKGIFNYIKISLLNNRDIKNKGVSRQYLSYSDQVDSIEDLFHFFENSFSNHNPLIKLAALDLIKYAFIAEGFNFRSGYITKIIPNKVLYSDIQQGGLDIIYNNDLDHPDNVGIVRKLKTLPEILVSDEHIDKFVRSHPQVVDVKRLSKISYKTNNEGETVMRPGFSQAFITATRPDSLVVLDNKTDNNNIIGIINKLDLKNKVNGYIRVNFELRNGNRETRLYFVNAGNKITHENGSVDYGEYYLIPLDYLEPYETYDVSYNENYHKFNSLDYYLGICEQLEKIIAEKRADVDILPAQQSSNILRNANNQVKAEKQQAPKYVPSTGGVQETMMNETAISAMANSSDAFLAGGAKMLINPIQQIMIPRALQGNNNAMYILNNNVSISNLIPEGKAYKQTITDENGNSIDVIIAHMPKKGKLRPLLKNVLDGKTSFDGERQLSEYSYIIKQLKDTKTSPISASIYRISIAPKPKSEEDANIRFANTVMIDDTIDDNINAADRADVIGNSARRGMDIDNVSATIIKQITFDARRNNSDVATTFVRNIERRGVNKNFRSSLAEHRSNIYTAAARYYQTSANALINKINSFELLGENYDMSEEKLYDVLAEYPEYFSEVAKVILDAVTFGNRVDAIFSLDASAEDKDTKEAIESIRRSINSLRTNTKVRMAMNNLINIYFKRYSSNPMIIEGMMKVRDQFGDIDTAIKLISDSTEINNNEVQIILKQVYTMFSRAEMFETKENVKEWQDELERIDAMLESLDMNKVIDFDSFRLRQDYNEKYIEDRNKVLNEYHEAKNHRFDSVEAFGEYLRKQYARDKFMYEHTEQPIVADYYKEDLENRQIALEQGGRSYIEYRMLSAQLYEANNAIDATDEESSNRIDNIRARMSALKSITNAAGAEKPIALKKEAEAINNFLTKRREINEKYFNSQEYDGFQETYQRYNSFIKSYDNKHSEESLDTKLENAEYREAYEWIKNNGRSGFTKEASDKIAAAFKTLVDRTTAISSKTKLRLKNIDGAIDDSGTINPMALTDEQIALLKEEEESELSIKYTNGDGEMILIKDIPKNVPLRFRKKKAVKYKQDPDKAYTIGRINQIISKATNHDTGKIDIATLFNNEYVTDNEREELARLYEHLYARGVDNSADHGVSYTWEVNEDAYNSAMNYYNLNLKNTKQGKQFLRIVTHLGADGKVRPNLFLYGYKVPFEEFVDPERTEAFRFIQDNIEFVPTEYYYEALNKASSEGRYDEWFNLNHVYNPFTHRYEPLKIWTRMQAKPNSELAKSVEYVPSFDNMERSVKNEYINSNYKEFGSNYKPGDSRYDSSIKRNAKEQTMYDLIQRTLNKYATTYQGKRFVGQGYLPRERETQVNGRWALGQIAALFGASWHSGADSDSFHETVDYSHDRDAEMNMLQLLKGKGSKEYKKLPNRIDFENDDDYRKALEATREENRQIAEENRKIDNKIVNKDFRKVMEDFVYNATIFNSRQAAKPYLYLLLEDLAVNNAYMIKGMWNKRLVKDYDTSTRDDSQYRRMQQNNTRDLIHNLARRLLYSQYHDKSTLRTISNFMQNLTSAKYMVFNLYGGIANVATGKVNIAMEEFANEYFGFKEFANAERKYLTKSLSFIASAFTDKSPNLIVALCKEFKVVDFDQVLQFGATADNLDARMRKVRNFMYSFQSSGEHFMQNSVLLAMLASNRLYTDSRGNVRIGDFKDFTWDVEDRAMRDVLAKHGELLTNYELYRKSIGEYNIETRLELSIGHKNLNRNFLYSLRDNVDPNINALYKKIAEEYHKKRKELMDAAKEEFNTNPTVESLYKFENGEAVIKDEAYEKIKGKVKDPHAKLETLIAEFREKVKRVNNKIHGVYDKDGAALIESKWWGSLVMQYHKHLPTGILKRWRRKGYYSEFRGSMERGTYQTLIDFIGTEFTNFKTRINNKQENGTNIALASIQVAIESAINTITNVTFNWNNLSNWERANVRRNLAEVAGVLVACLVVMALYGLSDDDDINDDRFKASLLYLADRLYSETTMYGPQGLISEAKTNWSQPVASLAGVNDLIKAITLIPQALFDPDYNPEYQSGRYSGMNKFEVLWKRNTVGLRNLDRILTIDKNNSYYKLEKSQIGISVAKNFGDILAGRE